MRSAPSRPAAIVLGIVALFVGILAAGMGCSGRGGGQAAPADPASGGAASSADPAGDSAPGDPSAPMSGATGSSPGAPSPGAPSTGAASGSGGRKANVYMPVPDVPEPPRSPNESP